MDLSCLMQINEWKKWIKKPISLSSPDWSASLRPSFERKTRPDALIGPNDSTATGWKMWWAWMFENYAILRVAASSAADPASRATAATYESANGQMTVTFQVSGFPASQGTRDRPSGSLPSNRLRPSGSFVHGMPAETIARATKSFRAWCLAGLPGAFLQTKPCSPCASTRISPVSYSTLTKIMHLCCRELNRRTSGAFVLGSRCPIGDIMSGGLLPAPNAPAVSWCINTGCRFSFWLLSFVCWHSVCKNVRSLYTSRHYRCIHRRSLLYSACCSFSNVYTK